MIKLSIRSGATVSMVVLTSPRTPIRAGLLVSDVSVALDEAAREVGEIVGPGKWLAYIEPDEWYRLRHERSERARNQGRSRGRPEVALLGGLARCEQCGEAIVIQRAGEPIDGTRRRTSTCRAHLHGRGDCDALPFDAEEVEATVLGGLDRILDRSTAWADAHVAGRSEEQARMKAEVDVAEAEIAECEQAMEKLVDDFDAASVADDDATKEPTRRALLKRRDNHRRATTRPQAVSDALAVFEEGLQARTQTRRSRACGSPLAAT